MGSVIKKIFKCILLTILLLFIGAFSIFSAEDTCHEYVEDMIYDGDMCNLDNYLRYNMLSHKLKKYIKKEDLKYSTNQEIWDFAQKLNSIDHHYNTNKKSIISTDSERYWHNPYHRFMKVGGDTYIVSFWFVFEPKLFSFRPKVVDIDAHIHKMS